MQRIAALLANLIHLSILHAKSVATIRFHYNNNIIIQVSSVIRTARSRRILTPEMSRREQLRRLVILKSADSELGKVEIDRYIQCLQTVHMLIFLHNTDS